MTDDKKLLTITDIARRLGVSRGTIYKMVDDDRFPKPVAIPGAITRRWNIEHIDAWRLQQK